MSLSRIPKDKREQGASATLKLLQEPRDWETKIVNMFSLYSTILQAGDSLSNLYTSYSVSTQITVIPKNNCEFECSKEII